MTPLRRIFIALCVLSLTTAADAQPEPPQAPPPAPAEAPADTRTAEASKVITVDREAGVIDLKARMVPAEPQWLELIATTPGPKGREHEAIVTVDAKPSHIHLELVLLGLKPGHPLINRLVDEKVVSEDPVGPEVELFFVTEKDGQPVETPVHEWVVLKETGKPIPACKWLFTGSTFKTWQGREYYMADEAGNIASLVNFGDDLIVRQTDTTQDTDFQQLQINAEAVPPYGSELVLRIKVTPPEHAEAEPGAETDPASADPGLGPPVGTEPSDKPAPDEP